MSRPPLPGHAAAGGREPLASVAGAGGRSSQTIPVARAGAGGKLAQVLLGGRGQGRHLSPARSHHGVGRGGGRLHLPQLGCTASRGARALVYNKPELRNQGFVIGLDDRELDTASGAGGCCGSPGSSGSGKSTIAAAWWSALDAGGAAGRVPRRRRDPRHLSRPPGSPGPSATRTSGGSGSGEPAGAARRDRGGVAGVAVRGVARASCAGCAGNFVEIYVATPLEECERRDVKGLYARARRGRDPELHRARRSRTSRRQPPELTSTRDATPERVRRWKYGRLDATRGRSAAVRVPSRRNSRTVRPWIISTSSKHRSVHILREAYANFKSLCMLWSIGKDSTVLLWLARKAFFGHVPFPLVHIDTSFKIPEMIALPRPAGARSGSST